MGDYGKAFEWIDFPQGRIRYAGQRHGRDEPPIDTFAVEIGGRVYYGEIGEVFLADGNRYNLEIVSFGWLNHEWFGTEPNPKFCAAFTLKELGDVPPLVCQAVPVWRNLEHSPPILHESYHGRFMGEIIFRDGWALIKETEQAYG